MTTISDREFQLLARLARAGGSGLPTLGLDFVSSSVLVAFGFAERRDGRVFVTHYGRSEVEGRAPKAGPQLRAVPPSAGVFRG